MSKRTQRTGGLQNSRSSTTKVHTVVDMFSGAGGLSEGFRQAGFRILAGADSDPDALSTYASNFPEAEVILGDVRLDGIRERIRAVASNSSVLVGGPPCQAFSQVRNHNRVIDDPRNALYREFVDTLQFALPDAFLMENVTGIDQMGVREQISTDLALEGEYNVSAQVVDAADFGVPQTRKRLLFVGVRSSIGIRAPRIFGSGASNSVVLSRILNGRRPRYKILIEENIMSVNLAAKLADSRDLSAVTAMQAISDLAILPVGNRQDSFCYESLSEPESAYQELMRLGASTVISNVQVPRMNEDTIRRLRSIPQGGNHRDLQEELLERYLTGHRWGQDNGTGKLSRKHFYAYRRLHPNIWAWTLNTKADCVYHYECTRALSVREMARIQSFPDRFVFMTDPTKGVIAGRHEGGQAHSRYRQVGNAVPPLLAKRVAEELLNTLNATDVNEIRLMAG